MMNLRHLVLVLLALLLLVSESWAGDLQKNFAIGIATYNSGNYDRAIELFTKVLNSKDVSQEGLFWCYHYLGGAWLGKGDHDKAIADLTKAIELNPNIDQTYYFRGTSLLLKRDYDKAITDFAKVIELNPNRVESLNNRSIAYEEKGMFTEAVADAINAIEISFEKRYRLRLSRLLEEQGRLSPNGLENYIAGRVALYRGDSDLAIKVITKAIESGELSQQYVGRACYNRGLAWLNKGNYENAIADYTKAIESLDDKEVAVWFPIARPSGLEGTILLAGAYNNRGSAWLTKDAFQKAIADYTKAIELEPKNFMIYKNRGYAWLLKKEQNEAIADFSKAIELNSKYTEAYYLRGISLLSKGDHDKAIADLTKTIELNPKHVYSLHNRSIAYEEKGMFTEAVADARRVTEISPDKRYLERLAELQKTVEADQSLAQQEAEAVDIDVNIPKTKMKNPDAVALIIGNGNYEHPDLPAVRFAHHDVEIVRQYLVKTLGYKEGNIIFKTDVTKAKFEALLGIAGNHRGTLYDYVKPDKSDVFIYYSGHGAPDPNTKKGYFIPADCDPAKVALNGYSLDIFYENLSKLDAKSITVVIDACFSGGTSSGTMLIASASPIGITVKNPAIAKRNTIILTSSKGDQISSWYDEKEHGLFTYFFLKALCGFADRNKDNKITFQEIYDFVSDRAEGVPYWAKRLHGGRIQIPTLQGSNKNKVLVRY